MMAHRTHEGDEALNLATHEQRAAHNRLQRRCGVRGVILLSDGNLQVGFESLQGRDREAVIAPNGDRVSTRNTWSY
jgi:hypothetical protein